MKAMSIGEIKGVGLSECDPAKLANALLVAMWNVCGDGSNLADHSAYYNMQQDMIARCKVVIGDLADMAHSHLSNMDYNEWLQRKNK